MKRGRTKRLIFLLPSLFILLGFMLLAWLVFAASGAGPASQTSSARLSTEENAQVTYTAIPPLPTQLIPPPTQAVPLGITIPFGAQAPATLPPILRTPMPVPTIRPLQTPTGTNLPDPTRSPPLRPSGAFTTYADPNLGFTFRYPDNWFLEGHEPISNFDLDKVIGAYTVRVLNYEIGKYVKRQPLPSEVQIVINARSLKGESRNLLSEILQRDLPSGVKIVNLKRVSINGLDGYTYQITPADGFRSSFEFAFRKNNVSYVLEFLPDPFSRSPNEMSQLAGDYLSVYEATLNSLKAK